MRHLGSSLTGALKGLMGEAISVAGGCFNKAMRSGNIMRSMSTRLGTIMRGTSGTISTGVTSLHITSTVARVFGLFGHYGGCVSRAAP